mgnify:CR=1 FL=1
MKKLLYVIFLIPQLLLAQCVIDKQIDSLYYHHPELHPSLNPSHQLLKQFTLDFATNINDRSVDEIVIPVVYHIVHDNGDENISEEQIIESLLQVNEDFNALNPELPGVHDSFQSLISDVGIIFKLAEFNPNGEPTTGIHRIQSDLTYNGGNIALKELVQWPPDQYLNIWVVYSSDGSNGSAFAFYPADVVGSGSIYDGIVASYWAVGRTGTAIPSHYKILSHEIGHWANLMHTWGDGSSNQSASGCSFDDGVDDTPNSIGNTGCDLEAVSCGSLDNVQNYMDYSNCSAMFTEGQKTRMLAALYSSVGNRDNIWSDENLEQVFIQQDILPRIVYSSGNYNEHSDNDGRVEDTIGIHLLDLSFSSLGMLEQGVDYSTLNLPEGLDLNIQVIDSTNAIIVMQGQVSEHSLVNSVNNIEIHFTVNPFNSVVLDEIYNPSKTNVSLTFIDPYSIVFVDKVNDLHNLLEGTNWNWFSYGVGSADFGLWTYDKDNFKLEIYSNAGVCYNGTRNLIPFESGELIGPANTFTYYDGYPSQLDIYNEDYTEWAGKIAYAGVTFQLSGNQHYGWLRIKVNNDASEAWVMDMAYNEAPNQSIITGEVQSPVISTSQNVFYESNDNDGSIRSIRRFDLHGSEFVDFESTPINNGFSITNLPSGLSAILNRVDSTTIQIELTGNAISHNASSIPITIIIDPSLIDGTLPNNLSLGNSIIFEDAYQVVYQDVDDFTVSSSGDDWHWFSIGLSDYGLWYNNQHLRIETYGKSLVSIPNTELVSSIGFGEQIQENLTWEYSAYCYECQPIVYSSNYTSWAGDTAYVGLKIPYQENFHYGWLRLLVTEDGSAMTLLDYAYNQAPNMPIATGQSSVLQGCNDESACNYGVTEDQLDNSLCFYATDIFDCFGDCIDDIDGDEVCDVNEIFGCDNQLACNYDIEATEDDGSCEFPEEDYDCFGDCLNDGNADGVCDDIYYGCMDSLANNYSEIATYDDGTCQYPGLSLNPVPTELCLGDTVLISWSGGNPQTQVKISLSNVTLWAGAGQIDMVQNTGEYLWVVQNVPPGPGDTYMFYIETDLDPPSSWSYGSHFTICPIYGCTNIEAFNYNPNATLDDGTCLGDILGCTNSDACNYNEDATVDDGNCYYAWDYYDCDVNCLGDEDFDGVCDELEVVGCQNVLACNFNEFSTDAALCLFPDLYYNCENQCNNDVDTDGVCDELEILGCQDEQACNYNSSATDNDLCIFIDGVCESCSDGVIIENDEDSDGICDIDEVFGCTNPEAFNYNLQATQEDNSCIDIVFGCMDPQAINYNPIANTPNSNCEFVCQSPVSWDYANTGINHTLMIPSEVDITISGQLISFGSTIGVFYTNENGELQCAGSTSIVNETTFIAVMGDDSTTDQIDGLQEGQDFVWMVWDVLSCEQYELNPSYSEGPTTFTVNGLTFLDALEHYTCQQVVLPGGWYTYSSYIQADDMDAELVMSSIVDNLVILKDNVGNAYLTEWAFNGIGELDFHFGYQLKTNTSDTLEICGLQMYPEDHPIILQSGWNLISYLRESPSAVDVVLEDLNSNDNLLIVKDYNGNPYLPEWDFNGIGDMSPGQGYQLKVYEPDTINYLSNDLEYRISTTQVVENRVDYFAKASPTGNNMHIVIPQDAWDVIPEIGSEIAAYNSDGILVGSAKYSNPTTVLTLWGDDITTKTIDGLLIDEPVVFKVWDKEQISDYKIENWAVGANTYQVNAINVAAAIEIKNFIETTNLFDAIPNPTQTKTNISFFVTQAHRVNISVYNIVGELEVVLANSDYDVGFHQLEMDVSQVDAGTYFYTMRSREYEKTKQLIILK